MNPLGCRIFDMHCGWPMYRQSYSGSFRYLCGLYQQSHGSKCEHNDVDGPTATQFVLSCVQQKLASPGMQAKLEQRIRQLAAEERAGPKRETSELPAKEHELKQVAAQLKTVSKNMALAETPQQRAAMAIVFNELSQRHAELEMQVKALAQELKPKKNAEAEVDAALACLKRLVELGTATNGMAAAGDIIRLVNARLFVRFEAIEKQKRIVNKIRSPPCQ